MYTIGTRYAGAIAIACSTSAVPAHTGEGSARKCLAWVKALSKSQETSNTIQGTETILSFRVYFPLIVSNCLEKMNSKENLSQGATSAGEDNHYSIPTPTISPPVPCTRCSGESVRETPRFDSGVSLEPDPLVQFLMVQISQLAKRLDKAESTLPPTQNRAEPSEGSTCAESVADGVVEDGSRWATLEAEMMKRQQAEEALQEECRQLREELKQLAPTPAIDPYSGMPLMDDLFPMYPKGGTKKQMMGKLTMSNFREGLRVIMKICSIVCVVVGIVALSRLPGQVGGLLRLMDEKQNDRGMGIYVRW